MNELDKLRWRCRRGTLELDLMLIGYLENHYCAADQGEQQAFLELLAMEDSQLMHYLMGEQFPGDRHLLHLLAKIRGPGRK